MKRSIDKPFLANPPEDKRWMSFPSDSQLPVPQVSMRQTEDRANDWKRVGPRRADVANALLLILLTKQIAKSITKILCDIVVNTD